MRNGVREIKLLQLSVKDFYLLYLCKDRRIIKKHGKDFRAFLNSKDTCRLRDSWHLLMSQLLLYKQHLF